MYDLDSELPFPTYFHKVSIWPITPAAGVPWLTRALIWGPRPSKEPIFGARGVVLAPVSCKTKKDCIDQEAGEKYEKKVVWNDSSYCLASYWWIYFCLVLHKRKRATKPLLGRQNGVTSTGGRHNLVHRLTTERRRYQPYVWCNLANFEIKFSKGYWFANNYF